MSKLTNFIRTKFPLFLAVFWFAAAYFFIEISISCDLYLSSIFRYAMVFSMFSATAYASLSLSLFDRGYTRSLLLMMISNTVPIAYLLAGATLLYLDYYLIYAVAGPNGVGAFGALICLLASPIFIWVFNCSKYFENNDIEYEKQKEKNISKKLTNCGICNTQTSAVFIYNNTNYCRTCCIFLIFSLAEDGVLNLQNEDQELTKFLLTVKKEV